MIDTYIQLAEDLVAEHLPDWVISVVPVRSRRRLGYARTFWGMSKVGELGLSVHHMELDPYEEVKDTILHEIAHFIAGIGAGHGHLWKKACRQVGANPEREKTLKRSADFYKYSSHCPDCGQDTGGFHRRPTRDYICRDCRTSVKLVQNW